MISTQPARQWTRCAGIGLSGIGSIICNKWRRASLPLLRSSARKRTDTTGHRMRQRRLWPTVRRRCGGSSEVWDRTISRHKGCLRHGNSGLSLLELIENTKQGLRSEAKLTNKECLHQHNKPPNKVICTSSVKTLAPKIKRPLQLYDKAETAAIVQARPHHHSGGRTGLDH